MQRKTVRSILAACVLYGCANSNPDARASSDPNVQSVLKGWQKCALFSALNEAATDKSAEAGADAAMALCHDEEGRYVKALIGAHATPEGAAQIERQKFEDIRGQMIAEILGWRNR
ncbi:MAG TPA: hypothetical protein VMW18_15745 [Candidatus Binatia bacterium]|nr:hypothetical protein [Candidatus Binatia bacterium]